MAASMSGRVYAIQYRHRKDGLDYEHKFAPGVELRTNRDGTVELERPDGRRLWRDFPAKRGSQRFLINPRPNFGKGRRYNFHGSFNRLEAADRKADAVGGWVTEVQQSGRRRFLVLTDRGGGTMARKNPRRRRKSRARTHKRTPVRRRRTARKRTNPVRRRRHAAKRSSTTMAKRRRRRSVRRNAPRHRRRAAATHHRKRRRRSYRRNPRLFSRGMLGGITAGLIGGAVNTLGLSGTVIGARYIPLGDTFAGKYSIAIKQGIAAVLVNMLGGMVLPARMRDPFMYGAFSAPWQAVIRASNVPLLSSGLGECDAWGVAGYVGTGAKVPPSMAGYVPASLAPAGLHGVEHGSPSYSQLGLQ